MEKSEGTDADDDRFSFNQFIRWSHLELGTARFQRVRCIVLNHSSFDDLPASLGLDVIGILGLSLFSEITVTLDYPEKRLLLDRESLPSPDGETVLRYDQPLGIPQVRVSIGGITHLVVVDTGSYRTAKFPSPEWFHFRSGLVRDFREGDDPRDVDRSDRYGRLAETFQLGKYEIENLEIAIGRGSALIGGGILKHLSVTVDLPQKRVRFLRKREEPIVIPGERGLAIGLTSQGGHWFVTNPLRVEQARRGDVVTAINGNPVKDMTIDDWVQLLPGRNMVMLRVLRGSESVEFPVPVLEVVPGPLLR